MFGQKITRKIFRYRIGKRTRYADPVVIWSELDRLCGESWLDVLKVVGSGPPPGTTGEILVQFRKRQDDSARRLANAVSIAFEVPPLAADGSGLTVAERIALATDLARYVGGLAEQARPFASSPNPTDRSPAV